MRASALIALLLICGCSRDPGSYTENDVRDFVHAGMPRDAVIKRFGEPLHVEKNPRFEDGSHDVDEIIYYVLPIQKEQGSGNHRFTGFQVGLKQGKVIDWLPSR